MTDIGLTGLISLGGGGGGRVGKNRPWVLRTRFYFAPRKAQAFHFFFLSFHNPNNRFESMYIFCLPFFNGTLPPNPQKLFLAGKHIEKGGMSPLAPLSYACDDRATA